MSSKLRLLVDENVDGEIARWLGTWARFNVVAVCDVAELRGSTDDAVMKYARQEDRIILTGDCDFNDDRFPICSHPGIIRLAAAARILDGAKKRLSSVFRSGKRDRLNHSVTRLQERAFVICGPEPGSTETCGYKKPRRASRRK